MKEDSMELKFTANIKPEQKSLIYDIVQDLEKVYKQINIQFVEKKESNDKLIPLDTTTILIIVTLAGPMAGAVTNYLLTRSQKQNLDIQPDYYTARYVAEGMLRDNNVENFELLYKDDKDDHAYFEYRNIKNNKKYRIKVYLDGRKTTFEMLE